MGFVHFTAPKNEEARIDDFRSRKDEEANLGHLLSLKRGTPTSSCTSDPFSCDHLLSPLMQKCGVIFVEKGANKCEQLEGNSLPTFWRGWDSH